MTLKPLILAVETSSRIGSVALAEGPQLLAETTFSSPLTHSTEMFPAILQLLNTFNRTPKQVDHIYISIGPGSFTGLRIAVSMAKMMHLANHTKIVTVDSLDAIAANVVNLTPCEPRVSSIERRATNDEFVSTVLDAKRGQFFIAAYAPLRYLAPSFTGGSPNNQDTRDTKDEKRASGIEHSTAGIKYRASRYEKVLPDSLTTPWEFLEQFACAHKPIWLLGDGLLYHKDKFQAEGIHFFDQTYWSPRASKVHLLGYTKAIAGHFANPLTLTPNYLLRPDIRVKPR